MKKEFWNNWENKTAIEKRAIKSINFAEKIILHSIPKNEIISIYIKGSFVRREMNEKSDVDTFTILKHSKLLKKLIELNKKYREKFDTNIDFTGYSLWELKNNKKSRSGKPTRPSPSRAVQHLDHYKLIYGSQLKKDDFNLGNNLDKLKSTIKVFRKIFLPAYQKKEFGFSEICKQVFWLVEDEQRVKGADVPYSWERLDKSIKDKDHIIHDTLHYRLHPTKDEILRKIFLKKLWAYLDYLEKKY